MQLKTPDQIKRMRDAGLFLWETHQVAHSALTPGISTAQINAEVENHIYTKKATPLFKGVPGITPFPAATCISINEEVVHGIPSDRKIMSGDIVSIDIGVKLNGWCADAAVTYTVGEIPERTEALLSTTENALRKTIVQLGKKSKWSLIVRKTSEYIHKAGFSIIEELAGHGIGTEMWETPQVLNYYDPRNQDFRIKPGMTLAIEPMVNTGTKEIETLPDHWTIVAEDRLPSAHFEHTVAVTENGPEVLTCGPNGEGWGMP